LGEEAMSAQGKVMTVLGGRRSCLRVLLALLASPALALAQTAPAEALPSWNEGAAKQAIVRFVTDVTTPGAADFVAPENRIAVFDNDGTLWAEQPLYFQFQFMLDQVKAAAPKHPEWKDDPVFKALAAGDRKALAALGTKRLLRFLAQTNSGMTTREYDASIRAWLHTAQHPRFHRPYTDLVYLPMQELLKYLRNNGFKTFIVSGGSVEFMRPWAEQAYGIPPEQIVGTITATQFETRDGQPVLMRLPKIDFVDDGPGKPVGIYRSIGRQPILAFGNSDGDWQMLQWTAAGKGPHLMGLVHHTDAVREYAYDRQSAVGRLDKALDDAHAKGWTVVDMKSDWKRVFSFQ
jgi:phosphoglycolate phosphatase-like HAD superfamily hydrolase